MTTLNFFVLNLRLEKSNDTKLTRLTDVHRHYFFGAKELSVESKIISKQLNLYRHQKEVESGADYKMLENLHPKFPTPEKYFESSLAESIYLNSMYYFKTTREQRGPAYLSTLLDVSTASMFYQFFVFLALAKKEDFGTINSILNESSTNTLKNNLNTGHTSKPNMLNKLKSAAMQKVSNLIPVSTRKNVHIDPLLATMLFKNNKALREEFCALIKDDRLRKMWARDLNCHKIFIDCVASDIDMAHAVKIAELEKYRENINVDQPESLKYLASVLSKVRQK